MTTSHIPEVQCFTPMPYTRVDLLRAIEMITGPKYVSDAIKLKVSIEVMLDFARLVMFAQGRSPYAPSCRVVRQAHIDLEFTDRFNFHGESG